MLTIFNRKELTICQTQARCQAVCAKLDAAGIEYQTRARDRSSPSPLAAGARERSGTLGQNMAYNWTYTIYVRAADLEKARAALRCPPLPAPRRRAGPRPARAKNI